MQWKIAFNAKLHFQRNFSSTGMIKKVDKFYVNALETPAVMQDISFECRIFQHFLNQMYFYMRISKEISS